MREYNEPVFTYQPKRFEIGDDRVRELAKVRTEMNETASRIWTQTLGDPDPCLSLETLDQLKASAEYIAKAVPFLRSGTQSKGINGFDKLVLKDIEANARVMNAYLGYFHLGKIPKKGGPRIEDCVDGVFGKGSWDELKTALHQDNFPHRLMDEYSRAFHETGSRTLDSLSVLDGHGQSMAELRREFKRELDKSGKAVDKFSTDAGIVTTPGEYILQFARAGFSYWEAPHSMASIDEDRFLCHRPNGQGEYQIFSPIATLITMHEVAGHMNHDIYQERIMPQEMVVESGNFIYLAHSRSAEGAALAVEELGMDWMKENAGKLKLSEGDLRKVELFKDRYAANKLPRAMGGFLNMIQLAEERPGFDADKKLAKMTRNTFYQRDPIFFAGGTQAWEYFQQAAYFFGQNRASELVGKMRKKDVPEDQIQPALMAGIWCDPKAQEKFIFKHFLPAIEEQHSAKSKKK